MPKRLGSSEEGWGSEEASQVKGQAHGALGAKRRFRGRHGRKSIPSIRNSVWKGIVSNQNEILWLPVTTFP